MIDLDKIVTPDIEILNPKNPIGFFNKPTNQLILAIDFDGTIVEDSFPNVGKPNYGAIESLKFLNKYGVQLILWTCRDNKYLTEAIEFLNKNGIVFTSFNDNSPAINFKPSKKIYADYYLDDRSFPCFPGWYSFISIFKTAYGIED